jgi:hypothetical protein
MKISAGLMMGVALIASAACKENASQTPVEARAEAPEPARAEEPEEYIPAAPGAEEEADPRNFGRGAEGLSVRPEEPHPVEGVEPEQTSEEAPPPADTAATTPPGVVEEEEALEEEAIDTQANGTAADGTPDGGIPGADAGP